MRIGYHFWGFMSDMKMSGGKEITTPEGNAFFSWTIVNELARRGHTVYRVGVNRDVESVELFGDSAFAAFARADRSRSYRMMRKEDHPSNIDLLLLEWRWPIPGRNTYGDLMSPLFQPDLVTQDFLLSFYRGSNTRIVACDFDYKMSLQDKSSVQDFVEFGFKSGASHHVEAPFDFGHMHDFQVLVPDPQIVYVGNRYERDAFVDKYLALKKGSIPVDAFGNWLESGRDSASRWPTIRFGARLQPRDWRSAYQNASVTPLILKEEYCENGFMTPRIEEALFFGCLPLVVEEFVSPVKYVPDELVVHSGEEVAEKAKEFSIDFKRRHALIEQLRNDLSFMDVKHFVDRILNE